MCLQNLHSYHSVRTVGANTLHTKSIQRRNKKSLVSVNPHTRERSVWEALAEGVKNPRTQRLPERGGWWLILLLPRHSSTRSIPPSYSSRHSPSAGCRLRPVWIPRPPWAPQLPIHTFHCARSLFWGLRVVLTLTPITALLMAFLWLLSDENRFKFC